MAQLNANLLNRIATPVDNYTNMVQGEQAVETNQFNLENAQKEAKNAEAAAEIQKIASTLFSARDPNEYAQRVQLLKSQGITFDPGEDAWENKDALQSQAMSLAQHIAQGKDARDFAFDQEKFAADQGYKTQSLGIDRERLAIDRTKAAKESKARTQIKDVGGRSVLFDLDTGAAIRDLGPSAANSKPPSATLLKAGFEAQDANAQIDGALSTLMEARALLTKGGEAVADDTDVLSGFGAGARGELGAKLPDMAVPDFVASPNQGSATSEYGRIMSLEAIKNMAATLKGASTDRELFEFQRIQADPSIPNDQKLRSLDRMIRQLDRSKQISAARLKEMGSSDGGNVQQGGGETIFGEVGEIPEGAIVEDEEGNRFQKNNGTLEAIE